MVRMEVNGEDGQIALQSPVSKSRMRAVKTERGEDGRYREDIDI